jgi:hypothetical protein
METVEVFCFIGAFKTAKVSHIKYIIVILGCNFELRGNMLMSNKAGMNGGAIYYDLFPPKFLRQNLYLDNEAKYGPNYASYPFCLKTVASNNILPVKSTILDDSND